MAKDSHEAEAQRPRFDPQAHLMTMQRRQRQPDGSYRNVQTQYLEVKWRIVWFRDEHPNASIESLLLSTPGQSPAVVVATVTLENGVTATGFGQIAQDKWSDYLEKAETRAIGRALALLGYGTQFTEDLDDPVADSPVEPQAGSGRAQASNTTSTSNGKPKRRPGASSYSPLATSGDAATDAINIMERVQAAATLAALHPIIANAKTLDVLSDSDVSGALVLKLSDALEKAKSQDNVQAIDHVARKAGVAGLGAYQDARQAAMERIGGAA